MMKICLAAALAASLAIAPARADDALVRYGDVAQVALPLAAAGVAFLKGDTEGLARLGASAAASKALTFSLKRTVDAERPNGGVGSFPSDHTQGAFVGASFLHYRYGWEWGLPAYALAAAVGYSRVEAREHYWRDVLAGAALANVMAYAMARGLDDEMAVAPVVEVSDGNVRLSVRLRF